MRMSHNSLLSQSLRPRIIVYTPNGNGRDSYILSNNGGFYKEYAMPNVKEKFKQITNRRKYDLSLRDRPINRYYANGNGRDLYVVRENPSNRDNRIAQIDLPSILRNEKYTSHSFLNKNHYPLKPDHLKNLSQQFNVQKNVLDRLFYGRGDSPERAMCPKVHFLKKNLLSKGRNLLSSSVNSKKITSQFLKESFSFSSSSNPILREHLENIFKNRIADNQDG